MNTPTDFSTATLVWSQSTPTQPGYYWFWNGTEGMSPQPFALTDVRQAPSGWWLEMTTPPAPLSAPKQVQGSLSIELLREALALAVRHTIENDPPEARKAWLTEHHVWALYPALYRDLARALIDLDPSLQVPNQNDLIRQLAQSHLIARPRAVAVRETGSTSFSHLNLAVEIAPEHVWGDGEQRPPLWYETFADGPALKQVADLMGLPPIPEDQPRLALGSLLPKPQSQPDQWAGSVNPRVVLAIYWQAAELAPEEETRSIF
ncbi:hypothetical protein [Pseudomonas amygdali]|uniref:hypothetical protein n=1 Tax=Pseudomonas amygdali TaxID=47877 RepID=UPI0006E60106|nr:hypothetical protein [Pseudomonas amygdali]KPY52676.1 hypothetical protein ALO93_200118 [Pseudomonas amygdali pv. sesami]RMT99983.1 hypothetical protein ALP37_200051 [Pseudomonas amygdali pv. sesami]RMV82683.1 hypothetical protein ALP04_01647 [Pseudomonas amygdali pv. sesami]